MIDQLSPSELSRQLMKPEGDTGRAVADALNESNKSLYDLAWEHLDLKPGQNLLEIGFGNGKHFPRYLETEPDLNLTGLDFSADMCREAASNNPDLIAGGKFLIHYGDTRSLPLEDNTFDWIIGINILYFWRPPGRHLTELFRVLKPGGHLLLGYRPRHRVEHLPFTRENFTLYEPDELATLLTGHGFAEVTDSSHSFMMAFRDTTPMEMTDCCLLVKKTT